MHSGIIIRTTARAGSHARGRSEPTPRPQAYAARHDPFKGRSRLLPKPGRPTSRAPGSPRILSRCGLKLASRKVCWARKPRRASYSSPMTATVINVMERSVSKPLSGRTLSRLDSFPVVLSDSSSESEYDEGELLLQQLQEEGVLMQLQHMEQPQEEWEQQQGEEWEQQQQEPLMVKPTAIDSSPTANAPSTSTLSPIPSPTSNSSSSSGGGVVSLAGADNALSTGNTTASAATTTTSSSSRSNTVDRPSPPAAAADTDVCAAAATLSTIPASITAAAAAATAAAAAVRNGAADAAAAAVATAGPDPTAAATAAAAADPAASDSGPAVHGSKPQEKHSHKQQHQQQQVKLLRPLLLAVLLPIAVAVLAVVPYYTQLLQKAVSIAYSVHGSSLSSSRGDRSVMGYPLLALQQALAAAGAAAVIPGGGAAFVTAPTGGAAVAAAAEAEAGAAAEGAGAAILGAAAAAAAGMRGEEGEAAGGGGFGGAGTAAAAGGAGGKIGYIGDAWDVAATAARRSSSTGSSALFGSSSIAGTYATRLLRTAATAGAAVSSFGWGLTSRSRTSLNTMVSQSGTTAAAAAGPAAAAVSLTSVRGATAKTAATGSSKNRLGSSKRGSSMKTAATALTGQIPEAESVAAGGGSIHMLTVVKEGLTSPYKGADWVRVLRHMAQRLQWTDERFVMTVVTTTQLQDPDFRSSLQQRYPSTSPPALFLGIGLTSPDEVQWTNSLTAHLPTALFWDSAPELISSSRVDGFAPAAAGPWGQLLAQVGGWTREGRAAAVMKTLEELWGRHSSDDLLYIWLVVLNQYVTTVPSVANTTKGTDLASLQCMIQHCGQQILDCVTDSRCKTGLDCLQGCAFNDQVCQYRCIVSYETPKFGAFALCILQLHNCRNLTAEVPMKPDPAPMTHWRGEPLTHDLAEDLFIGWLPGGPAETTAAATGATGAIGAAGVAAGATAAAAAGAAGATAPGAGGPAAGVAAAEGATKGGTSSISSSSGTTRPWSWLIAAGKNPAYDYFPCQHQLFYRGKGRGQFWYEPVFKAITLDGDEVWRRRRYRVRRGTTPGTFYFTVLDNGVTSNEYWRIIDCADDLSYCLFYYSGAAAAAGLSYSGAVLGTVDGAWPAEYEGRIKEALERAGIEDWELTDANNKDCVGAPLDVNGKPATAVAT